jgi:hypothetical protein
MSTLIDLVGIALFSNWLLGWFEPLNKYRNKLVDKMINTMVKHNLLWAQPLLAVFNCPMCLAFWSSLIYTKNFTYALIASFMALVFNLIITLYSYVKSELN